MYLRGTVYYTNYYDGKGNRFRKSLKTSNPVVAEERERLFISFLRTNKPIKTESIRWRDFKNWYEKYLSNNKAAGTKYIHMLAVRYMEEYQTPKYLRDITPDFLVSVKGFLQKKAMANKDKPGPAGRNRSIKALKTMMRTAELFKKIGVKQDWRVIARDSGESDGRIEFHSLEELNEIRAVLEDDLQLAFYLGWEEGLRRGEIVHLCKSDYNPYNHTITISKKPGWVPKTKKSARTIPLRPQSEKLLKQAILRSSSPYFINLPGDRYNKNYLSYSYRYVLKKKLPHLHCFIHKLRHTYGTLLIQNGVHVKVVCDLMGHSNILQTEKYLHVGQSQFATAVASLPSLGT